MAQYKEMIVDDELFCTTNIQVHLNKSMQFIVAILVKFFMGQDKERMILQLVFLLSRDHFCSCALVSVY